MRSSFLIRSFKFVWVFLVAVSCSVEAFAQAPKPSPKDSTLPKVFTIGDHETKFEKLQAEHAKSLLSACENDMQKAFDRWNGLNKELEDFGAAEKFDLAGIKMWAYVFWDGTGRIEHIAYYLKPNSRFVRPSEIEPFLEKFVQKHRLGIATDFKFSHYGSMVFPTASR